jgi:hypothetical protein
MNNSNRCFIKGKNYISCTPSLAQDDPLHNIQLQKYESSQTTSLCLAIGSSAGSRHMQECGHEKLGNIE